MSDQPKDPVKLSLEKRILESWIENRLPDIGYQVAANQLLDEAIVSSSILTCVDKFAVGHPPRFPAGPVDWDKLDVKNYKLTTAKLKADCNFITDTEHQKHLVEAIQKILETAVTYEKVIIGSVKVSVTTTLPCLDINLYWLELKDE